MEVSLLKKQPRQKNTGYNFHFVHLIVSGSLCLKENKVYDAHEQKLNHSNIYVWMVVVHASFVVKMAHSQGLFLSYFP